MYITNNPIFMPPKHKVNIQYSPVSSPISSSSIKYSYPNDWGKVPPGASGIIKHDYYYSPPGSDTIIESSATYTPIGPNMLLKTGHTYTTDVTKPNPLAIFNPMKFLPFSPQLNSSYYNTYPYNTFGVNSFHDISRDKGTIKSVVKYYYQHMTKKWMKRDLSDVLNYFVIKGDGSVDIIESVSDYSPKTYKKYSQEEIDKIIEFIKKYLLTKTTVTRVLEKYAESSKTKFYDLPNMKFYIKPLLAEKIIKLVHTAIKMKAKST